MVPDGDKWIGTGFVINIERVGVGADTFKDSDYGRIGFAAKIEEADRTNIGNSKVDISNVDWKEKPDGAEITNFSLSMSSDRELNIYFILDGMGTQCGTTTGASRYVPGSAEELMNSDDYVSVNRSIPDIYANGFSSNCSPVDTSERYINCVKYLSRVVVNDEKFDLIPVNYIEELIKTSRERFGGTCATDRRLLGELTAGLKKSGLDIQYEINDCNAAGAVYLGVTGSVPNYMLCDRGGYSYENFSTCIARILDRDLQERARRSFAGIADSRVGSGGFSFYLSKLAHSASSPREDSSEIDSLVSRALEGCYLGRAIGSIIVDTYLEAQSHGVEADAAELRSSISCSDFVRFFGQRGLVLPYEQATFEAISSDGRANLCSDRRARATPFAKEASQKASASAAKELCSAETFDFVVNVAQYAAGFQAEGGICRMDMLGLPIASLSYHFIPETCENIVSGKAQCSGAIEMYCSAADPSREALDCAGKNASVRATVSYDYDEAGCEWGGTGVVVDKSTAQPLSARQ